MAAHLKFIYIFLIALLAAQTGLYSEPASLFVEQDSILTPGVNYRQYVYQTNRERHNVHVIEIDLINPDLDIKVLKAGNNISSLEKLQLIDSAYDATHNSPLLGAVNANFWRAYGNYPIGATVSDGEVIEMNRYKQWSSGFFDNSGKLHIDGFNLSGKIIYKGKSYKIQTVNRRSDSTGIVLYNKYKGDTIPFFSQDWIQKEIDEAWKELQKDMVFQDSTEELYNYEKLAREMTESRRENQREYGMRKIAFVYLDSPAVNKDIRCKAIFMSDSGKLAMPRHGLIMSLGVDIPADFRPDFGEIITVRYSTDVNEDIIFTNAVSGIPRLVRNGVAQHEAKKEGSNSRRFISHALPRTAIGTDKKKRKIFLVAVEPSSRKRGVKGVTLSRLAYIMKKIGAYNAMNLDGGGSTIMTINEVNIVKPEHPQSGRKISVGLGVAIKEDAIILPLLNLYE